MAEISSRLQNAVVPMPAIDRRAWVRYASDGEVACRSAGTLKDAGWPGKVLDISVGGIGLLLRHRFPPGAPLIVELKSPSNHFQRLIYVQVMHSRPVIAQGDACWLVGCAFSQPLNDAELQEFLRAETAQLPGS
jgi:hypothetical protein